MQNTQTPANQSKQNTKHNQQINRTIKNIRIKPPNPNPKPTNNHLCNKTKPQINLQHKQIYNQHTQQTNKPNKLATS